MNRTISLHVVLATLIATAFAAPAAQKPLYDKTYFEPTEEVITPHITWAKPYAKGPVKALFITHRDAMREVVELAQRMSLDYKVFVGETPNKFGETGIGVDMYWRLIRGNSAEELTTRLRDNLKSDYDVIVIGNFKWDELPIDCRYEILKKVKAGTGLCGFMPQGRDEYISKLLPSSEFAWNWSVWSGAANGVPDWLGKGDFVGKIDRDEKHTGETSLRIEGKEATPGSHETPRAGYNTGPIELQPNTQYRLSVWYRTEGLTDSKAMVLFLPAPGGANLPASQEWKKYEVTFNSGNNTKFHCYLLNFGVGTVWYDDVSLVKVGEEDANLLPNPGLELSGGPVHESIVAGFPYAALPAFQNYKDVDEFGRGVLQIGQFRKGRLAFLRGINVPNHQMMTPGLNMRPLEARQLDYDYYLALASRAILWAAHKEPQVVVSGGAQSVIAVDRQGLSQSPVTFGVRNNGAPLQNAEAVWTLRDTANRIYASGSEKVSLPQEQITVNLKLSGVPAGSYFADLWIKQSGKILGWGSLGINITSASSIKELLLDPDSCKQGDPIRGKVSIANPTQGQTIELLQSDNYGRVVARQQIAVAGGADALSFEMRSPKPLTVLQRVQARLLAGKEVLDMKAASFTITDLYPDRDDIRFVMWTGFPAQSYLGRYFGEEFARAGVDTQYTGFSEWVPIANVWHAPYATRFTDSKTDWYQEQPTRNKDDLIRDPCLTDPEYLKKLREDLTRSAQSLGKYSTSEYVLGDECLFVSGNYDLCFSPTCIADFKRFVRDEYGDIAKLNKEWGTDFKAFDEVAPITLEDAQKSGQYARWVDHRRHMETVWASIYRFSRDVIHEVAPGARTGYEGSDTEVGSYHANDYWKLAHSMDLNNIYFRDFLLNAVRDFAEPNTLLGGGWYGGYPGCRNEAFMRWFPWMTLFKGGNSFWVWYGSDGAGAVMAPDLSLYPFFKANVQEVAEIKSGVGKLLMNSHRAHDGIAMLYSPSSVHVATFTKGFPAMDQILNRTTQLLHDSGFECRVLSYEEVKNGNLTNDEFKVLLLPGCQALSQAEVDGIKRFAQNGGTVIADLRPGVRNEHGSPYPSGALDELFGVKQNPATFTPVEAQVVFGGDSGKFPFKETMPVMTTDGSVALTKGQSLAKAQEAPTMIVNPFGKGQGVLLNFALPNPIPGKKDDSNPNFRGWAEDGPARELMTQLLKLGGLHRPVGLDPALPKVEVSHFTNRDAEYVGVIQGLPVDTLLYTNREAELPPAQPVKIQLPRKSNVYDIRTHKYLGVADSVRTDLQPGQAKLYALLPYKIASVVVRLRNPSPAVKSGDSVSYSIEVRASAGKPGAHVVRLRVLNPKKQEVRCYSRNVLLRDGKADGKVDLALNDITGSWTLEAMDVVSGEKGTAQIQVK